MKNLLTVIFLFAISGCYAQLSADQKTLIDLENQRIKAIVSHDSVALSKLYDEGYKGVLASGRRVTKPGLMEFQLHTNPYIKITMEGVEAIVFGDTGVTMGRQVNRAKSGTLLGQSNFMRVYIKRSTGWKIIRSQGTLIEEDQ